MNEKFEQLIASANQLLARIDTDEYVRALYAPHPVLSGWLTRSQLRNAILVANVVDLVILLILVWARGPLVAKGRLIHRTATMAFTEGTVYDAQGKVCSHATGTFKYVKRLPVDSRSANGLKVISTD